MTIALGFNCVDGIVLCSDSQMTSPLAQLKFYESKVHTISGFDSHNLWTVGLTCAGDLAVFKSLFHKLKDVLMSHKGMLDHIFVAEALQQMLNDVHANSLDIDREFVDVICGVSINDHPIKTTMYVSKRTTLHEEDDVAFAGVGDSSLSRFLASTLPVVASPMFTKRALLLGVYIIEQAKEFIDGCGGDIGAVILNGNGGFNLCDNRIPDCLNNVTTLVGAMHSTTQGLFSALTDPDLNTNLLEQEIQNAKLKINQFYDAADSFPTVP